MANRTIKTSLKIDGEKEFKKALSSVNSGLKTLKSDMVATTSQFKTQANSMAALTAKQKILKAQYDQQKEKVKALNRAYKEAKELYGENSKKADEYKRKLNYAKVALDDLDGELKKNDKYLGEAKKSTDGCAKSIDEFGNETEKAEKKTSKFAEIFKAAFWADLASRALTTVIGKIKEFARSAIEAGDRIGTMSEKIGLSTDRLQELEYAGVRLDVSLDTVTGSMQKLVRNMNSARAGSKLQIEAFNKLGIEITKADGSLRDANTVFGEAIDALGKVHGETERDAIAMQLFGKSAQDLNPLILAGSEELERLSEEAHEAGAVMSEKTVEALDNFDETVEQAGISAKVFFGEALAGIIGDGKTAAEVMTDLQDSLSETDSVQQLIDKYRKLNTELSNGSLSAEETKQKSEELEQAKQDLIKASGGIVTAFDIENGTFDKQVEVLEDATQAEKDYLKYKLIAQIAENGGIEAQKKSEKATKDRTKAKEGLIRANERLTFAQEKSKDSFVPEHEIKSREEEVEKWKAKLGDTATAMAEVGENAVETEISVRCLVDSGMTVSEIAEETGFSVDELNNILAETGDTTESTMPEVEAFGTALDGIRADYDAAYESALASLQGQYDIWSKAPEVITVSVEEQQKALDSNKAYFETYSANIETLMALEIPGVDMRPLLESIDDGTPEAAGRLQGLVDAVNEGNTDIVAELATSAEEAAAKEDELAQKMGLVQADVERRTEECVNNVSESIKNLDNSDKAAEAAKNTLLGFTQQLAKDAPNLVTQMETLGSNLVAALNKGAGNRSPSKKTKESAKNVIDGAIIGLEENKARLFALGESIGEKLVVGLSIGMNNSSGKVMETVDDVAKELAKRIRDIANVFSTSSDISELQFKLWEMSNDNATTKEKDEKQTESLNKQIAIQQSKIGSVSDAYRKMVELTGENSEESLKLQKQLLQEQIELEELRDTLEELTTVKEAAYDTEKLSDMAEQEFKLWSLENQSASDSEKLAKQAELLALKYEMQGVEISDTEAALAEMVEQYGANAEESVKLQEQLLKEKIAYMELKVQIDEVNRARGYVGGKNIKPSGFLQAAEIWESLNNVKVNTDISGINSVSQQDVGGMISSAVNALGTMTNGSNGRPVIELRNIVNGKEFSRAIIDDFRAVDASRPKVASDKIR